MAVTEITKILFRRGRESDRVELEALGGLAQGEPGFTSSGRGQLEAAEPDRYNVVGTSQNIRAAFLDNRDVIDHVNRTEGGGDFFVGGAGGKDVFVGGSSAEKHWQRYFVSLYGTANNTTWESSEDSDNGVTPGYINGSFHVGKAGVTRENTKNHLADPGDEWDVRFYGPDIGTEAASRTVPDGAGTRTIPGWTAQNQLHWDANVGKLSLYGGGAVTVPSGPLAARPSGTGTINTDEVGNANYGTATTGDIRYNTEWQTFEGYFDNQIGWGSLGGAISKDRQTYLIVDTMGGQDGCTSSSPNQWQPAADGYSTDNAMNLVIHCEPTVHSTHTLWRFLSSTQVSVTNVTDSTAPGNGSIRTAGGLGVAKNLHVGSDIVAFSTSDERLKENVTPIVNATQLLQQIQGVAFDWSEQSPEHLRRTHDIGVLAQQVEKIVPSAVSTRDDGYKAVDYKRLTPLLIASVNQLAQQVQQLTERVEHLQNNQ